MTEEGKKLFKKALVGLGVFILLLLVFRLFLSFTGKETQSQLKQSQQILDVELTDLNEETKSSQQGYSAVEGLGRLLHSYAYNHFYSNRFKQAIHLWEMASYLNPSDKVAALRLEQAKELFNFKVNENIALGARYYKYLHYDMAIDYWQRAYNLVQDVDPEVSAKIQKWITMAERRKH